MVDFCEEYIREKGKNDISYNENLLTMVSKYFLKPILCSPAPSSRPALTKMISEKNKINTISETDYIIM